MGKIANTFAALLSICMATPTALGSDILPRDRNFEVFREEVSIGRHEIRFSHQGDELHVKIAIDLEVKLAFITLFRYSHRNHEVWRNGRLISIDTQTDDDGEPHWVRGRTTAEGFAVESSSGPAMAPPEIIPTSYWRPETVTQEQLLDTQHGRLVEIFSIEREPDFGFSSVATRYALRGDLNLDLWYDDERQLAKIAFQARGAKIDYVLLPAKRTSALPIAED